GPEEADDIRRAVECAEHQGNAPVLVQVGGGLVPAPGQVQIRDRGWGEDTEAIQTLRREIDMTVAGKGRGCHEEKMLPPDKLLQIRRDILKDLQSHPPHSRLWNPT